MGNIIEFGKKNIKNIAMAAAGALLLGLSAKSALSSGEPDYDDDEIETDDYESDETGDESSESTDDAEG